MTAVIKIKRSSSTALTSGSSTLAEGVLAVTIISGVKKFYVGDFSNVAQEIGGDSFARLASPAFTGDPTAPTQSTSDDSTKLATTAFVHDVFADLVTSADYKEGVRLASAAGIANLSLITVADFDGQGQGVTLVEGDRVFVNHNSSADGIEAVSAKRKGIYVVGAVTAGTAALTRSTDANADAEVTNGMTIANVELGTYANYRYTLTTTGTITLDTTNLSFTGIPNGGYTAANGISITSNAIAAVSDATGGSNLSRSIDVNTNGIAVKIDDSTIAEGASNRLKVKAGGITATELATSVAGAGLAGGGGTALSVNVDDSSIEINTDTLRVKAAGVTNAMLAGSIADSKLSTITTANKVSGSAVQLKSGSALLDATGLDVNIDAATIINTAGVLSVGTIDAGTF